MRADFDLMLLDNARDKGAEVIEEIAVKELIWDEDKVVGVRARTKDGEETEFFAPLTFDATGKEAFTATRNGWRERDPYLNKVAAWAYYEGATRQEGLMREPRWSHLSRKRDGSGGFHSTTIG